MYVTEKYLEIIKLFQEDSFEYSFEQVVCILGFCYLRDMEVDYGVIEVGCGGARDSSNIVDPIVSVITSVGLDHMHLLGNTIEEIALEKAGVMKPGRTCVIGPDTPQDLLCKVAEEKSCKVILVPKTTQLNFIQENSKITEKIFEVIQVNPDALAKGLTKTQPFRFYQVEAFGKKFVVDVGHNVMSIQRVILDCKNLFGRNIRVVLCASKGKDFERFVEVVFNEVEMVHFTSCEHFRMVPVDELIQVSEKKGFYPGISDTFKNLLPLLRDLNDDATLIIGSCFMVEDVVNAFKDQGVSI
jgi:dihydrofolate synthase/folylpolyglutamate synthase